MQDKLSWFYNASILLLDVRLTAVQALKSMTARLKHAPGNAMTREMFLLLPTLRLQKRPNTAPTECVPLPHP